MPLLHITIIIIKTKAIITAKNQIYIEEHALL